MPRQKSIGAQYYDDIAEELTDPSTKLSDLNPTEVQIAKQYAKKSHKRWPPRPARSPYDITITTWSTDASYQQR